MSDRTAEDAEAAEEGADEESAAERATRAAEDGSRSPDDADSPAEAGGADPPQDDRPGEATPRENGEGHARQTAAGTETAETDPAGEPGPESETAASLADRVAEYDEALADEVRARLGGTDGTDEDPREMERELEVRESRIEDLESEVSELNEKLKRKQADFQNFKKRQQKKVADRQARATEELLNRLLPVRDNLVRALEQSEDADIRDGVEGTLREFDRVLDAEEVTAIEPDPGTDTDPNRHEVMMRVESDQPEGTVVDVFRPGYEMDDRVVRTAQVTVSDGQGEE